MKNCFECEYAKRELYGNSTIVKCHKTDNIIEESEFYDWQLDCPLITREELTEELERLKRFKAKYPTGTDTNDKIMKCITALKNNFIH